MIGCEIMSEHISINNNNEYLLRISELIELYLNDKMKHSNKK